MSDEFGELLELLHLAADDPITVCHQEPGGTFVPTRTTAADGPNVAARYTDTSDLWFSVNPIRPTGSGRGTATDVTRAAALFADLDMKNGVDSTLAEQIVKRGRCADRSARHRGGAIRSRLATLLAPGPR